MIPGLILHGTMPRRFFVPLEWSQGTRIEKLHRIMKKNGRGALYWLGAKGEVKSCEVGLDDCLPRDLWKDHLTLLRRHGDAAEELPLDRDKMPFYLDMSFSLRREDACALYVAWNPDPCPDDPEVPRAPTLVLGKSPWKSMEGAFWQSLPPSEPILFLHLEELALLPLKPYEVLPVSPPRDGFFEGLRALFRRNRVWRFALSKPFMAQMRPLARRGAREEPGSLLALDFGTSATTVALLPRAAESGSSRTAVFLSSRMLPWEHVSFRDSGHALTAEESLVEHVAWRGHFQEIGGLFDAVPIQVANQDSERAWVEDRDNPLHPSLLHELPPRATEYVVGMPPCAVGEEAENILKRRANMRGVEDRPTTFSPKRYISCPAERHSLEGMCGRENPIELYLRRIFDGVYFEAMSLRREEGERIVLPPLHRICYSYPVAWTRAERCELRQSLENALKKSFIKELLPAPDTQEARDLFSERYALDEASAAFLGYVRRRFQGLDAGDVVRILTPFSPAPEEAERYPKAAEVLVVDCGEGTTDLVWLTVRDDSGSQGDVESTVRHHFALDVSGLEVTRGIAEKLKAMMLERNPGARDILETILDKPNLDKEYAFPAHPERGTKMRYRRGLTLAFYEEAERIKIASGDGSSPKIQWGKILSITSLQEPTVSTFDGKLVKSVVEKVFRPAIAQIRRWAAQGPRLDLLLLSGRSGLVIGLQQALVDAIPEEYRPPLVDRVAVSQLAEEEGRSQAAKMVVCDGLVQHCINQMRFNTRAIFCRPIDERRRTRAVGVLRETPNHRLVREFDGAHPLLVDPDEKPIDPDVILPQEVVWTEMDSAGFALGINFSGRPDLRQAGATLEDYDSPRILCRYDLQWTGDRSEVSKARVAFRQVSASELRLARVVLERGPEPEEVYDFDNDAERSVFVCGPLTIEARTQGVYEDFRMTGRIYLEGVDAVDR